MVIKSFVSFSKSAVEIADFIKIPIIVEKLMKLINDLSKKNTRKGMAFLMVKRGSQHDRVICFLDNGSMGKNATSKL